ncbi:complex I subunit 5 family protein [Sediminispirochaeta smaragdinae]|uniref:NADH/Ubiquinone/plastoquinone (Complex I) n=1 Tax=Sediminispirochaeta smaragdinae (strain DSM 11293 / JCM 15392 / SEBR 4228) TaxID=573413 RepID=E1R814_SEDSS|nr:proton-conducting transporter membrane subunit [Sediminispirochaeta smaragdinae]ADK82869.1 NADH/Ubiquinone/plastoquinone (complex I) [Sediminispirochaeta smaragdinae DSM 11293]
MITTHSPLLPTLISLGCGGVMLVVKNLVAMGIGKETGIHVLTRFLIIFWVISTGSILLFIGSDIVSESSIVTLSVGGWAEPLGIVFVFDRLSLLATLLILIVGTASLLYAEGDGSYKADFFFFVWFLLAACEGITASRDLFTLFVFFEILAISAYILIAYKQKPRAILASFRYLILATVSISFYLVGVFIIYRGTGSLSISEAARLTPSIGPKQTALALTALTVGIGTRMAMVPFHGWLPEAHSIAAHPVSALLSGIVIKAPVIVLFRIASLFPSAATKPLGMILLGCGGLSAVTGLFFALQQNDAKRLLAYHSVSQMGYIVGAFALSLILPAPLASVAAAAALFHAFNHGLFKSLLFLSVGSSCDIAGSRNVYKVRGLCRKAGIWFPLFLVGAFSIAAVPLFNGYVSKYLFSVAMHHVPAVYALFLLVSAGTTASFIKLGRIYFGVSSSATAPEADGGLPVDRPGNIPGKGGAVLLAAGCLGLGLAPLALIRSAVLPQALRPLSDLFSASPLFSQTIVLAAGVLLFFIVSSPPGRSLAHHIRERAAGTDALLGLMIVGFLVIWTLLNFQL